MTQSDIVIRGAREHNLRNIDLRLPRNKLIVMTGVSGSGKSSLAFDTLYAEGQRRYVESLSSYARQFLGQMPKPDVDAINGLAPSISIQQKASGRNPRSTVGTITEIYDYLRVLFARVGQGNCHKCGRPITAQTTEQIIDRVSLLESGTRFQILAPLIQQQKGEYRDLFDDLLKQGFLRARVNGRVSQLTQDLRLDRQMKHTIEVVVDRLTAGKTTRTRLAEAVENALKLSHGTMILARERVLDSSAPSDDSADLTQTEDQLFSSAYACTHCGISYEPPTPQLFSFNSPQGMCLNCNGLGMRYDFLLDKLIPDPKKSIAKGAIDLIGPLKKIGRWRRHIYEGVARVIDRDLELSEGTLLKTAWQDLPLEAQELFLRGMGDRNITFEWRYSGGVWKHGGTYDGLLNDLLESYRKSKNPMRRRQLEKYMQFVKCGSCRGGRLNKQARSVTITSTSPTLTSKDQPLSCSLPDLCALSILQAWQFFDQLALTETQQIIAVEALKEIRGRLGFLLRCGLDYLTLDRTAPTLSGGESQRIRLAGQIGCGLVGVVYILDEPSIGLHPRDNKMLLESLCDLRDQGNTVIVVEHDEETMRAADHIVDFGPGPGIRGGMVVAQGTLAEIKRSKKSVTGQFLSGKQEIAVPKQRRSIPRQAIKVVGARHNNLKRIDATFPIGTFICVTGVSGSGKSSLVNDILWQVLNRDVNKGKGTPGSHQRVNGLQYIDKAIDIDQSPIGRTPRSNPATYVKLFDHIRDLFTKLPESRLRGYKPGRFSFNVASGRCESCEGHGSNKLEMDFLADIWVKCAVCEGHRFNHETLQVRFKDASIADVLEMDVQQALEHFENIPKIVKLLQTLHAVGLDYLKLGQPSPTLSGGEAQRIKLARELGKRSTGQTLYLLDEPTTGLHFADIQKLLEVLHGFVDAGNTVLVVEHNLDVIKTADWIIDLGPDGGEGGGTIISQGAPEEIAACPDSYTGQALCDVLPNMKSSKRRSGKSSVRSRKQKQGLPGKSKAGSGRWQVAELNSAKTNGDDMREITVRGAAQHNLQTIDVTIPRDKLNVFCGPSGSGKSSLAMDTLYAEGQRRYVESLSAYARQFLGQMPKPRVEHIHGLSPAIAIEQKSTASTPRSTVGTVTEIYDYLRILFARLGTLYCPKCNVQVNTQTTDEVIEQIRSRPSGTTILLLAPQEVQVGQSYERLWEKLKEQGFRRVRVDNSTYRMEDIPKLDRKRRYEIEVVIDRITIGRQSRARLADSIEAGLDLGRGVIRIAICDNERPEKEWTVDRHSLLYACEECGRSFDELTPHNFSFNSPLGWCDACEGLGVEQGTNLSALVADPRKTLSQGAVAAWPDVSKNKTFQHMLKSMAQKTGIPLDVPFDRLSPVDRRTVLYGSGERWIPLGKTGVRFQYKGLYPAIEEASRVSYVYRQRLLDLVGEVACSACVGSRLRDDSAAVRFHGKTLQELCELPLEESVSFLKTIKLNSAEKTIAGDLLREATSRLSFLVDVGLDYLALNRPLPTLSGGESQRIRLAGQIGRALTGVLYVLDEPTIGLHPRDNGRLLVALKKLRDLGNTLILVEHDREVLNAADRLYDFGPGAGRFGGSLVDVGTPKQLARRKASLTGEFLSHKRSIAIPNNRRGCNPDGTRHATEDYLEVLGARLNNLRDVDLRIPLGTLTCVTGVSGSGKSSLIEDTLAKAVAKRLHRANEAPGPFEELVGLENINKVIVVDQRPLGNTPKSNPGTYTGVFDHIRELFTKLPDAKVRGYRPGRFSFNRSGGRCETCEGNGQRCIEMHFLPDVWVECDECHGSRYNRETLNVKYHGKSISDVLDMSIGQALELFENIPKIRSFLATLCAIGLDYLTLGQPAPTLSGGEAQRVKLAAELARPNTGRTLYILDEPTTGLHFDDIDKLLKVLNSLVELGSTVVVIEHNLDVIKTADWVIDLGPEAGHEGGQIIAQGTPEEIVKHAQRYQDFHQNGAKTSQRKKRRDKPTDLLRSHTGEMLAEVLRAGKYSERAIYDVRSASKPREGDVNVAQIGRDAKMPWQTDGRRWHTVDRIGHSGKPCRWEGSVLERVIDKLEATEGFRATDWSQRHVVEITGQGKTATWFLHALTGDEWLVHLTFRVCRNTFKQDELQARLGLRSVDDIDELAVYGRSDRVRVKNAKGPWQQVTVTVHWLNEIDTPEFWQFLDEARDSYLKKANQDKLNPDDLTPWKVLGRKWHLKRKGFPSGKRVAWKAEVLQLLFDLLEKAAPETTIDWGSKAIVTYSKAGNKKSWATVHTKRRTGIDLSLYNSPGKVALGRIAQFGSEREIKTERNGREVVKIRFDNEAQISDPQLKQFIAMHANLK